ncbi:MAG TPA: phosphoribosyltransferase [Bacillota bacterium]|nr:phosphoribosyltransferase [Bacillota bacterium]
MVTLASIIDEALVGIITSVLGWLFTKSLPIFTRNRKVDSYKLMVWTIGLMMSFIPVTMLVPSTVLPDRIRVYIILILSCFVLVLFLLLPQNHPCGVGMATKKKHFQSKRIPGAEIASIYRVPLRQKGEKVEITWTTFILGIHILKKDLEKNCGKPNIIFGINPTGIIMATYFSNFYGNCPLGIVRTGQEDLSGDRSIMINYPEFHGTPDQELNILFVDDQIKTGKSARKIQNMISGYYKENGYLKLRITYIALGGVLNTDEKEKTKKDTLTSYDFGWEVESEYKPAFVAFYLDQPGLKSPEFLR